MHHQKCGVVLAHHQYSVMSHQRDEALQLLAMLAHHDNIIMNHHRVDGMLALLAHHQNVVMNPQCDDLPPSIEGLCAW